MKIPTAYSQGDGFIAPVVIRSRTLLTEEHLEKKSTLVELLMNCGYWNCCLLLALVGGGASVGHRGEWNALMETLRPMQLRARISLFPPAPF